MSEQRSCNVKTALCNYTFSGSHKRLHHHHKKLREDDQGAVDVAKASPAKTAIQKNEMEKQRRKHTRVNGILGLMFAIGRAAAAMGYNFITFNPVGAMANASDIAQAFMEYIGLL